MIMNDIVLFIVMLFFCFVAILAENNAIGHINENLETIKPKLHKIKIPERLAYYIPQYCRHGWETPPPIKSELYMFTVVLAICNYIFHLLCMIVAIIIHILIPSAIVWIILPLVCFLVLYYIIATVTEFKVSKIERKNQGRLSRDFTIEKHDKKE